MAAADRKASTALLEYERMNYADAAVSAKAAYDQVVDAAHALHIRLEPREHPERRRWRRKGLDDDDRFDSIRRMQRVPGGFARAR